MFWVESCVIVPLFKSWREKWKEKLKKLKNLRENYKGINEEIKEQEAIVR
jgi:hypothetical protein